MEGWLRFIDRVIDSVIDSDRWECSDITVFVNCAKTLLTSVAQKLLLRSRRWPDVRDDVGMILTSCCFLQILVNKELQRFASCQIKLKIKAIEFQELTSHDISCPAIAIGWLQFEQFCAKPWKRSNRDGIRCLWNVRLRPMWVGKNQDWSTFSHSGLYDSRLVTLKKCQRYASDMLGEMPTNDHVLLGDGIGASLPGGKFYVILHNVSVQMCLCNF